MSVIKSHIHKFLDQEDGPTAVEYAVLVALIVVACIGVVTTMGTKMSSRFSTVSSAL